LYENFYFNFLFRTNQVILIFILMKRTLCFPLLLLGLVLSTGCKKTDNATIPVLTTAAVTNITLTTAASGGDITSDGKAALTARGVCWAITANPTTSNSTTNDGTATGAFVSNLTGLTAGTTYYLRAYATNSVGTGYGDELSFTTTALKTATVTTDLVTAVTTTTAVSGGNVTADNGSPVTAKGVCWGLTTAPTIAGSHSSDGTGTGAFVSNLTGLLDGTPYFVRAYATNGVGTSYGNEVTFTTVTATAANEIVIQSMAFIPASLTVPVGTTVKWKNKDAITHTVTSDTGAWDSGNITGGGTFSFPFTAAGTYHYHCSIHPNMLGTIIVQ
jgi:plastocyanin